MTLRITVLLALLTLLAACSQAPDPELVHDATQAPAVETGPVTVKAPDGVVIAATVHSVGQPTVVLVHGWMCDQTYWEAQVPALAGHFGVVTVDVAGHGLSGTDRQAWTIASLGDDVAAVITQLELSDVIVVGHSMGGRVGLEVARLLPGTVAGVIGVDTLQDADYRHDPEETSGMLAAFDADFTATCGGFVRSMFVEGTPEPLVDAIDADMCSGPGKIGIALMRNYISYDEAAALQAANVPVRSINADIWPTNVSANQKYADFEAVILKGYGHFLMQEAPEELNRALIDVVMNLSQPIWKP